MQSLLVGGNGASDSVFRIESVRLMSKKIVEITDSLEIAGFIKSNGTQCRFVSLVTSTEPKIKKGNPYPGLRKVAKHNGLVNVNFADAVARRISAKLGLPEGSISYTPQATWYKHVTTADGKPLPLVEHSNPEKQGTLYLQFFPQSSSYVYVLPNGDTVKNEDVERWLYAKSERPDFKPAVITIGLDNIRQIKASGVIMTVEDLTEAEADLVQ